MNWRRGLIFASIHVAIAIVLVAVELVPRYETEKNDAGSTQPSIVLAAYQEEGGTVDFAPACNLWRSISLSEKVLMVFELPAVILSGWGEFCPARWTTAGLIGIDNRHHSLALETELSAALCGLIGLQWILLGGMPLVKPRKWWLEPGACNTASICIGLVLLLIGYCLTLIPLSGSENALTAFGLLAVPFLLLAFLTWFAWPVLIIGRIARFSWRLTTKNRKPLHSLRDSTKLGGQP